MDAFERKGMHMFAVRYRIHDIGQILSDAGMLMAVSDELVLGRPVAKDRYVLAEFSRNLFPDYVIPRRLFRARLCIGPNGRPVVSRQELLHLTDEDINVLMGAQGPVDTSCDRMARLHRRIDIAMRKFRRHAALSASACRIASFWEWGDKMPFGYRVWHLVRMAHTCPGMAAYKIGLMLPSIYSNRKGGNDAT